LLSPKYLERTHARTLSDISSPSMRTQHTINFTYRIRPNVGEYSISHSTTARYKSRIGTGQLPPRLLSNNHLGIIKEGLSRGSSTRNQDKSGDSEALTWRSNGGNLYNAQTDDSLHISSACIICPISGYGIDVPHSFWRHDEFAGS
jgi:hypothetical protein